MTPRWPDKNGHYHLNLTMPLTREMVEKIRNRDYDDLADMTVVESLGEMLADAVVSSFDRYDDRDSRDLIGQVFDD